MADVKMPDSVPCKFNEKGWNPCKEPSDNGFCSEHEGLKCVCCGKQATRSCDAQMGGLACGIPLCENCQHSPRGDGTHVTREIYEEQVREEGEFLETGKESKRMLALRGVPTDVELPHNLKELLDANREDFSLVTCYYVRIRHGLMGEFPAIIKGTHIAVITSDKDAIFRVWQSLSPKKSEIVTAAWMVNSTIGVGYYMSEDEFYRKQSLPQRILSGKEIEEYFLKDERPFEWLHGLIGAGISQQEFEEFIQKELVT